MGAVKNFYHDEICGLSDAVRLADFEMTPLREAVRQHLAREINKPRHVADILEGKWDDTPAFRKLYGQMWLLDRDLKESP